MHKIIVAWSVALLLGLLAACLAPLPAKSQYMKPPLGSQLDLGDPINDGLAGCWLLNEGAGTRVGDISCNGSHLAASGVAWQPGLHGSALYFNGSSASASLASLRIGSDICTFTCWFYPQGTAAVQILWETSANLNQNDNTLICYHDGTANRLYAGIQSGVSVDRYRTEYIPLAENTGWHHLAVIFRNDTTTGDVQIFLDGIEQETTVNVNTKDQSGLFADQPLYVGARNASSYYFTGLMESLAIYQHALSASEIARLYYEPFAGIARADVQILHAAMSSPPAPTVLPQIIIIARAGIPVWVILAMVCVAVYQKRTQDGRET